MSSAIAVACTPYQKALIKRALHELQTIKKPRMEKKAIGATGIGALVGGVGGGLYGLGKGIFGDWSQDLGFWRRLGRALKYGAGYGLAGAGIGALGGAGYKYLGPKLMQWMGRTPLAGMKGYLGKGAGGIELAGPAIPAPTGLAATPNAARMAAARAAAKVPRGLPTSKQFAFPRHMTVPAGRVPPPATTTTTTGGTPSIWSRAGQALGMAGAGGGEGAPATATAPARGSWIGPAAMGYMVASGLRGRGGRDEREGMPPSAYAGYGRPGAFGPGAYSGYGYY